MGYFGALLVEIFFGPSTQTFLGVNERPCTKFQDNWMSLNERGVFTPLAAGLTIGFNLSNKSMKFTLRLELSLIFIFMFIYY